MTEQAERYSAEIALRDPAQLKVLYDPLRYRLFGVLREAATVGEAAESLGVDANGLYYHVRVLLRAGLISHVGFRTKGTHTERTFQANRVRFSGEIDLPQGEGALSSIVANAWSELAPSIRAIEAGEHGEDPPASVSFHVGPLSDARAAALQRRLAALFAEFTSPLEAERAGARRFGMFALVTPLEPPEAVR